MQVSFLAEVCLRVSVGPLIEQGQFRQGIFLGSHGIKQFRFALVFHLFLYLLLRLGRCGEQQRARNEAFRCQCTRFRGLNCE
jgi:hypothetical protein